MPGKIVKAQFSRALPSIILLVLIFGIARTVLAASPSVNAFTYQGSLNQSGAPASGNFDFKVGLYAAASGGSQVGTTVTLTTVNVDKGRFTVNLDFGAAPFDGSVRWLKIDVRPSGSGAYSALAPLQPLTATPNAIQAQTAQSAKSVPWSGVTGAPNTAYTAGAGLQLGSNQFSVKFAGSGSADLAARSDHNHGSTYLTPAAGGSLYLPKAGPGQMTSSSTLPVLDVVQNGSTMGTPKGLIGLRGSVPNSPMNGAGVMGFGTTTSSLAKVTGFPTAGVRGESSAGWGVMGVSDTFWGVFGLSRDSWGIYGETRSTASGTPAGYFIGPTGVQGVANNSLGYAGSFISSNMGTSRAIYAMGSTTITQNLSVGGVLNVANNGNQSSSLLAYLSTPPGGNDGAAIRGVLGGTTTTFDRGTWWHAGVRGESDTMNGVVGISGGGGDGTIGDSRDAIGVFGRSTNAIGVQGTSLSSNPTVGGGNFFGPTGIYSQGSQGYGGNFSGLNDQAIYANGRIDVRTSVTAGSIRYSTPRRHVLALPTSLITPWNSASDGYSNSSGFYGTIASATFQACVSLPDRASVTSLVFNLYDNSTSNIRIQFWRQELATGAYISMLGQVDSSTGTGTISQTMNFASPVVIDNDTFGYFLYIYTSGGWDGTNLKYLGGKVIYTVSDAD